MASIRKRGEKYDVRYREPDGTERTRTCPSLPSARALARKVDEARALGHRWEPGQATTPPGLTEARDAYTKWRSTRKRANTLEGDEVAMNRFIGWLKGRRMKRVDALTIDLLLEWDEENRSGPGRVSARSANHYIQRVRHWMAWCSSRPDYRAFVPPPPESRILDLPAVPWVPPHAPTWAQMDAAIGAARTPWLEDALVVMRCTGLRVGQMMRLRWDDLHEDGRDGWMLHVRPELGKTKQERAGRLIPVTRHLVEHFAGRGVRTGWLVAPEKRAREVASWQVTDIWERSKVPDRIWRGHTCHCFRYGFETGLTAAGGEWQAVEHLVGHAVKGSGSSYLDTRWALKLREAVDLVPPIGQAVQLPERGTGVARGRGGRTPE